MKTVQAHWYYTFTLYKYVNTVHTLDKKIICIHMSTTNFDACHGHLSSIATGIKSHVVLQPWLSTLHTPEGRSGWRSGMRPSVLWKTGRTGLHLDILWAQFLYLLISRKALNSFKKASVPHDCRNPQKYVLKCMNSPFTKIIYILPLPL